MYALDPKLEAKFTTEIEIATKGFGEALLKAMVPDTSSLTKMADRLAVPIFDTQHLFAQVVANLPKLEMARMSSLFPVVSAPIVPDIDLEYAAKVMRECEDGSERLAQCGWTMPLQMTPGQILETLRKTTEDEIDQEFIAFYHDEGELSRLKPDLLDAQRLKTWRTLLAQCFENYEAGKHQICIPALLSILEGVLALPEKEYFIKPQERIDFFKNKVASSSGSTAELLWKTLDTFFAMLYAKSDFNTGSRPTSINRHWILHGRDEPDAWRPADALRLMHALSTVSAL